MTLGIDEARGEAMTEKNKDVYTNTSDEQVEIIPLSKVKFKPPHPVFVSLVTAIAPFLPDPNISSEKCSQKFLTLGTSAKGQVCLSGTGQDFVFNARYITEVIPCLESRVQKHPVVSTIEAVGDVTRYWLKKTPVKKAIPELYTAIKIAGKYNCTVFVKQNFEAASAKLSKAVVDSRRSRSEEFNFL